MLHQQTECMQYVWLKGGGDSKNSGFMKKKSASEQVQLTELVTRVTNSEFRLPRFLERITRTIH